MVESQLQQRFLGSREYREGKRRAWQRMEWLYHEVDGITGRRALLYLEKPVCAYRGYSGPLR